MDEYIRMSNSHMCEEELRNSYTIYICSIHTCTHACGHIGTYTRMNPHTFVLMCLARNVNARANMLKSINVARQPERAHSHGAPAPHHGCIDDENFPANVKPDGALHAEISSSKPRKLLSSIRTLDTMDMQDYSQTLPSSSSDVHCSSTTTT